jgi:tellurite resistance protein TehA-like permease
MGIFALTTSIAMLFVLFVGFKKGQKWAWWAFLFVGGISWLYGLAMQIAERDMMNLVGHLIGTVLWLLGILLAVKVFFPKKA